MSRTVFFLLIILIIWRVFVSSQTIWYFGNGAGIEFTSYGVKPVSGGKIFTNEGCSAAYDERGNLLFYTDGRSVWDKNHALFLNGEGLNGNVSSTQSALVIPKPGDNNKWFVFTSDALAGNKGICYSIVNYWTKKVELKNQKLLFPATEKLTATFHANGKDYWLLAHEWNSNKIYAYQITEKGIGIPVVSQSGVIHKETGAGRNREAIGEMKFSPDGKKLVVAISYRSRDNLEVFDFDNSTGGISNPQTIAIDGYPYGVCFSPGNSKLYVSFLMGESGIIQYDMNTKKISEIVTNERNNSFGSIQAGPDGKIYIARNSEYLDVISFPEKTGAACGYSRHAIKLSPASCAFGLPAYIESPKSTDMKFVYDPCSDVVKFPFSAYHGKSSRTVEIITCEDKYLLDAGNFGGTYQWSTYATTQTILVYTTGLYKVMIQKDGCMITDSIWVRFKKDMAVFRYLPQFNPESSFLNSEFYYSIDEVSHFELKIYDSRKKLVFETTDKEKKWDGKNLSGKLVPEGEYIWKVRFTPTCPKGSKPKIQEGKVTVVRNKKAGQFR